MKTQEIDSLRACFPALDRTRNQRPVAYFDGPGGTQVPRCVVEAMSEYLCCHNANTHWAYATSIETDEIILSARHSFADFFNAAPEEVAFGANMTTLTYHVARALGRRLNRGDEVVITELDHHGNVGPWEALAIERGVGLRVVKMLPETGQLDWDDFGSRSRIFLLGAAGEQEENGLGASASGPARTLTQNVPLGSRVVSQKVNFLGQGNKGGSSRLPLGEERANILLLACCYQEGSNPGLNVWYELGFAIANGKPLVMICDIKARTSQFPFDVSHRPIITFVPESPRDFQALQAEITSRLRALLDATNRTQTMATIKSSETISGLSPHEMAALQIVMENHSPTAWEIKELMVKAGFTKLAGALSLQLLQDR